MPGDLHVVKPKSTYTQNEGSNLVVSGQLRTYFISIQFARPLLSAYIYAYMD